MDFRNKVECLSMASFSSLAECLHVGPGANPRLEHLKGATLRVGPQSFPQTLDLAGKACQGQTLYLILKIRKLQP